MNVLSYDPIVKESDIEEVQLIETTDEITEKADFITLHLPDITPLHHFINEAVTKKMKKGAYIIKCARGGLVNEVAAL